MTMVFCHHGWSAPRLSSSSGSPERLRGVNGASSGAEITSEWRGPRHTRRTRHTRNGWRRCMRHLNLYMKIQHVKLNKPNYLHCIRIYIYNCYHLYSFITYIHNYVNLCGFQRKNDGLGTMDMWKTNVKNLFFFKKHWVVIWWLSHLKWHLSPPLNP